MNLTQLKTQSGIQFLLFAFIVIFAICNCSCCKRCR